MAIHLSMRQLLVQFESRYGRDETKLQGWQHLCRDCAVVEGPSIKKCKHVSDALDYVELIG